MSNVCNHVVATVSNAMTIAGLEMLQQPELCRYTASPEQRQAQRRARQQYRINAIKRVIQSELDKPSTRSGDPMYFLNLARIRDIEEHKLIDSLETMPIVGSRSHERKDVIVMGNLRGFTL